MKVLSVFVFVIFISFTFIATAFADPFCEESEPSYCSIEAFQKAEVPAPIELYRAHVFRLGNTILAGFGVGASWPGNVKYLSRVHSDVARSDKYCTWYLNRGNFFASLQFMGAYMPDPRLLGEEKIGSQYLALLSQAFSNGRGSFASCAQKHGYIAMGCNGMMHRGPTVMGMMLAFSGCSPQKAQSIVDHFWGLNGVQANVRQAAIVAGFQKGQENPDARCRLRKALSL